VTVRKVWKGRGWLEEIEANGPNGHWEGMTLFPYNPQARQRNQSFAKKMFEDSHGSAILGASNCLCLAAAPTFAIMALLTGVVGSPNDLLCSAAHDASPITGMVAMYMLMGIFHSSPWLKLISSH
jgi:hypothetical protein